MTFNLVLFEAINRALFTGPLSGKAARVVRTTLVDPLLTAATLLLKWMDGDGCDGPSSATGTAGAACSDGDAGFTTDVGGGKDGEGASGLLGAYVRRVSFSSSSSSVHAAGGAHPAASAVLPKKLPPIGTLDWVELRWRVAG